MELCRIDRRLSNTAVFVPGRCDCPLWCVTHESLLCAPAPQGCAKDAFRRSSRCGIAVHLGDDAVTVPDIQGLTEDVVSEGQMLKLISLLLSCVLAECASANLKLVRAQAGDVTAIGIVRDPAVALGICMRLKIRLETIGKMECMPPETVKGARQTYIAVEVEDALSKGSPTTNDNFHLARSDIHVRVEFVRSTTLIHEDGEGIIVSLAAPIKNGIIFSGQCNRDASKRFIRKSARIEWRV